MAVWPRSDQNHFMSKIGLYQRYCLHQRYWDRPIEVNNSRNSNVYAEKCTSPTSPKTLSHPLGISSQLNIWNLTAKANFLFSASFCFEGVHCMLMVKWNFLLRTFPRNYPCNLIPKYAQFNLSTCSRSAWKKN